MLIIKTIFLSSVGQHGITVADPVIPGKVFINNFCVCISRLVLFAAARLAFFFRVLYVMRAGWLACLRAC